MKTLPQMLVRIDDDEKFTINEDGKTYSNLMMKKQFPNHLNHKWTYDELMNTGKFRLSNQDAYERSDTTY